ncbi:hypothetical protein WMF26_31250 [Sorangium sp. So ce185]|uniref:hypothetical protein n=1 Tax=Sorangium sp. So ce185 TaxID=3133287 RepID=UPI003F62C14B
MLNVPKALAATKRSDRALGAEVLAAWKAREPGRTSFPQGEAIGVKLGLLRKGDVKWWRNHPLALEVLAEILACRPEEIVPADDAVTGAIPISAFEELEPILPGQDACGLRDDGAWLGAMAESLFRSKARAWVVAPAGSGKTLALAVLRQRHGTRVAAVQCRRLADATRHAKAGVPLIVEIAEADPATDEGALQELGKAPIHVCVLSPYARQVVHGASRLSWSDIPWAPSGDWRERLLKWANARAPKPDDLDVEEVLHWLKLVDPAERLFATPCDVLAIAARAYRAELPRAGELRELSRESIGRLLGASEDAWLRRFGLSAAESLLKARLEVVDHPLGPLPLTVWARLLPADLSPAPRSSPAKAPRSKVRVEDDIDRPPAIQAVHLLADAGVLRTTETGQLDFSSWVRAGVERDLIESAVKAPGLDWALWAIEPTRRAAVDDALDASPPATLLRAVRRALAADAEELRTVAAIEALFSAVSRKLAGPWRPANEMMGDLQSLGLRQLQLVRQLPEGFTFPNSPPLTRQGIAPRTSDTEAWIAEAWTFSFAITPPERDVDAGWILPGWSRSLQLTDAPMWFPPSSPDRRWLATTRRALRACTDSELPAKISYALFPAVILDGPSRGWTLSKEQRSRVLFDVDQLLGDVAESEPAEVRRQLSLTVWECALDEARQDPSVALAVLARVAPRLHGVVLAQLPVEVFAASIMAAPAGTMRDEQVLGRLPPRLHRPTLSALVARLEREQGPVRGIEPLLEGLGEEHLDLLVGFAAHGYSAGYAAARRVWALAPETAFDEARRAVASTRKRARVWFDTAPMERCLDLLAVLQAIQGAPPSWCAPWLAAVLPRAGHAAPAVFALLRSIT